MKDLFFGYYAPSQQEYQTLLRDAVIVLDTNVLLNPYEVPTATREELLGLLESLKQRLWIPHHVALEFQENRLRVIDHQRKDVQKRLDETGKAFGTIEANVAKLDLDKRGIDVKSEPLLAALAKARSDIEAAVKKARDGLIGVTHNDEIRDRLDQILSGRVGPPPTTQGDLDKLLAGAQQRYADRVPPGFEDAAKAQNPLDAYFVAGGIKYERQFGDLILWRQLIQHVSSESIKKVLFVTDDSKKDWWLEVGSAKVGPLPELISEMRREGNVDHFWIYSLEMFMEQAKRHLEAKVSEQSLDEVRKVAQRHAAAALATSNVNMLTGFVPAVGAVRHGIGEECVAEWLRERGFEPSYNNKWSGIFVPVEGGLAWYDVISVSNPGTKELLGKPGIALFRGLAHKARGAVSTINLAIVVPRHYDEVLREEEAILMRAAASQLVSMGADSVTIGYISVEGSFQPMVSTDKSVN